MKKLKPKSLISAKMFHLFYLTGGEQYNEVQGNFVEGYKYKKTKISLNIFEKIIYHY